MFGAIRAKSGPVSGPPKRLIEWSKAVGMAKREPDESVENLDGEGWISPDAYPDLKDQVAARLGEATDSF